jgi:hypothetical protein
VYNKLNDFIDGDLVFAGAGFQLLRWMEAKMREWQMMSMPQG